MKFYSLFVLILLSCHSQDRKIFVKSLNANSSKRIDWYFYSLLNNFSRSYVQLSQNNENSVTIFESFFISDINLKGDTLKVELYKNDYKIDSTEVFRRRLIITVDTTGKMWNQASSRLGRLQKKNVDYFKPHFEDSYCSNGECY
jgi:hypothetical protein